MSFTIYKTFPKTLKFTSPNTHYSLGDSAISIKYVYSDTTGFILYNSSSNASTNSNQQITTDLPNAANLYELSSATNMMAVAFSSTNSTANISTSQEFYLSSDTDKISFADSTGDSPTSLVVQEIYPGSKDYSLLNGSFVTYKSNTKHKIVVGFEYLPKTTLDKILTLSKSTVIIVPEDESDTDISPFQDKAYVCNWEGSNLNFQYANPYKKAGYKGQISFREV